MANKICVLSIAGSDSGSGAGIQSDIKTFKNHGVYGLSAVTAVTAQNTRGVQRSLSMPARMIDSQLKSIFDDFKVKAVKTGMLARPNVIHVIAKHVKKHKGLKLVVDPVILSKNGFIMLNKQGIRSLKKDLLPLTYLLTPNIPEAEILTGLTIDTIEDLETAAVMLRDMGAKNVLIKGGHLKNSVGLPLGTDVLFDGKKFYLFNTNYISTANTHGIGCTLSAAITSNIAKGLNLAKSIDLAKAYVVRSLKRTVKLGKGFNPVEQ
ncbi:MAG: bifunctional hydroxymethylpyrimidine kinase/phosphomethylpyrimidine kinase [Ignavibacteria bacterium]|nr:bifunctional hydroxymethylpyrimidine kinase/phosphomethylpyrimidine kinase [Ignavibacteria bacterium]